MRNATPGGRIITPEELEALLRDRPEVRLLDVRTPGEFESVHIRGAYNVPLERLGEHAAAIQSRVGSPVVLICQSGGRARRAEESLLGCSMQNLQVLEGGMNGWIAAGGEVERGPERWTLERQVRLAAGLLAAVGALLALAVSAAWAMLPLAVGSGLVFAAVTENCGLAMLLAKLPYNRPASCDIAAMVDALQCGTSPARSPRRHAAAVVPPRSCTG